MSGSPNSKLCDYMDSLVAMLNPKRFCDEQDIVTLGRLYYARHKGHIAGYHVWCKRVTIPQLEMTYHTFGNLPKLNCIVLMRMAKQDNPAQLDNWYFAWRYTAFEYAIIHYSEDAITNYVYRCALLEQFMDHDWTHFKTQREIRHFIVTKIAPYVISCIENRVKTIRVMDPELKQAVSDPLLIKLRKIHDTVSNVQSKKRIATNLIEYLEDSQFTQLTDTRY